MHRVPAATVLGLNATQWTAIATIALAVVTIAYVLVTARMAKSANKSAQEAATAAKAAQASADEMKAANQLQVQANKSAAEAAKSAEAAALAAKQAAEIQLAELQVDFTVTYSVWVVPRMGNLGRLVATCTASTVWFHELRALGGVGVAMEGESYYPVDRAPTEQEIADTTAGVFRGYPAPEGATNLPTRFPLLMHRGESIDLLYPLAPFYPAPDLMLDFYVLYSLTETGEVRQIKRRAEIDPVVFDPTAMFKMEDPPR